MGRRILFITTDQQRFDALGCNGATTARTPVVDALAAQGVNYTRAHNQSVVCMPARATLLTGQYPRTHGVWMNGVALPTDAPSVAAHLHEEAGYRTALFGKAHFEPFIDPERRFYEDQMALRGEHGPHRGFEHLELASHTGIGVLHYNLWLQANHPDEVLGYYPVLDEELMVNAAGGGDTGAVQVARNPIERAHYHTDWVADACISWLRSLDPAEDWFVWLSFPDPHHPWDPPASELGRVDWRDLDPPEGWVADHEERVRILEGKPKHWLDYYLGRDHANYEVPPHFVPAAMTRDQVREINALTHIENELVDEAIGRVLVAVDERGWTEDTDVLYTTDHGELQGDNGLLFKGAYHVEALMRVPLVWRPAPSAGIAPATVDEPVGHLDVTPTFCRIAGVTVPDWMQGTSLPSDPEEAGAQDRQRVITEWESEFAGIQHRLRTITRDGWICTAYEPTNVYDGTEGELYRIDEDPYQRRNRWDDPSLRSLRDDLVADLYDHLPDPRPDRLPVVSRV